MRLLKWVGQKFNIAKWIISHFPQHKTYVEPFGGSMAVLLTKPPSKTEVYNDIDKMLVTFFLYVKKHPWALYNEMLLLPPSREITKRFIEDAKKGYFGDTELERVVRWWYLNVNTVNAKGKHFSAISPNMKNEQMIFMERVFEVAERLKNVVIESMDYKKVIEKYDSPNTLFYLDPPYLLESRNQGEYYNNDEWTRVETHKELYEIVSSIEGKVVISYYPHPTLEAWYSKDKGWYWDYKEVTISTSVQQRPKRTEWLIMNFDYKKEARRQLTLLDIQYSKKEVTP